MEGCKKGLIVVLVAVLSGCAALREAQLQRRAGQSEESRAAIMGQMFLDPSLNRPYNTSCFAATNHFNCDIY